MKIYLKENGLLLLIHMQMDTVKLSEIVFTLVQ
jgi:phosphotransferase system IIA component